MAYKSLDEFIIRLEQARELIQHPPAQLSLAELAQLSQTSTKALYFEALNGSDYPVAVNLFGSERRMAWVLCVDDISDMGKRLARLLDPDMPLRFSEVMARAGDIFSALRSTAMHYPQTRTAACQQLVLTDSLNVTRLPTFAGEGGAVLPSAQVITGANGSLRTATVDVEVETEQSVRFVAPSRLALKPGDPVALAFGGDPAVIWCAHLRLPSYLNPYLLAGWVRGKPVSLVRGVTQAVDVPADADFVLEGVVNHVSADGVCSLNLTALTHRSDAVFPIYQATRWTQKALEQLVIPLIRLMVDEIADLRLEGDTIIVRLGRDDPGAAHKAMFALWALTLTLDYRTIVVVSSAVDIDDPHAVSAAQARNGHEPYVLRLSDGRTGVDATDNKPHGVPSGVPPHLTII